MRPKALASLLAIVSMFMIVAVSWMPSASAWEDEGTETIDEDQYWYQIHAFFAGDYFTLSYTITVQNDVYIDVMLLNEENFNKYVNGQTFSYYLDGTDFNTIYKNVPPITLTTHDNYYIVVDNTDAPPGGAQPAWDGVNNYCTFHYTISAGAHYYDSGGGGGYLPGGDDDDGLSAEGALCGIVIIGLIVIVIIAIALAVKKKGRQTQPYYQPPYTSPDPYYRDQQPPPPPDYRPPQQP